MQPVRRQYTNAHVAIRTFICNRCCERERPRRKTRVQERMFSGTLRCAKASGAYEGSYNQCGRAVHGGYASLREDSEQTQYDEPVQTKRSEGCRTRCRVVDTRVSRGAATVLAIRSGVAQRQATAAFANAMRLHHNTTVYAARCVTGSTAVG